MTISQLARMKYLAIAGLSLAAAGAWTQDAHAQAIPYIATQFTQPYVPLSGATPLLSAGISFGDQSLNIPIGFTFSYYGHNYDYVEVGENGLLSFKPTCMEGCGFDEFCDFTSQVCTRGWMPNGDFEGLPSPNFPNRVVAAYWDDLYLDTTAPASVVQYRTIGAAPNRELIVEWRNMRHINFMSAPTSRSSFQIRLRETSNNIRLAYGPFTPGAGSDTINWQGRIGIEDENGIQNVIPVACSQSNGFCDWTALSALNNQVIEIGIPNVPELTGTVDPTLGGQPGTQVTLGVNVHNIGLQPTGMGFEVAFYLSSDAVIVPGVDTFVGSASVPALAPDGTYTATVAIDVPNLTPGYYTLAALIDSADVIHEATEANNMVLSSEPFLIGADLEAVFEESPAPLPPGGSGEVSFSVTNRSTSIDNMNWRVYLSLDTALDPFDPVVAEGTASFPGSTRTQIATTAIIPEGTAIGYYTLIAEVDWDNQLDEIDEFNNQAFGFVVVGPDLSPSSISAPASTGPGATLHFTLNIANYGSAVSPVEYRVYLSTDARLDAMDRLIATGTTAVAAAPNDTPVDITTLIPEDMVPGAYQFIVQIDPNGLIEELEEFNNDATMNPINLVGPDIVGDSISGAPLAFRGQPYALHAVISNVGGQPVRNFYVSFHLSVNQLITASDPLLTEVGPLNIDPGQHINLDPVVTIDPMTQRGPYWLGIIADSTSIANEDARHQLNNIKRSADQITVRDVAPDFVITEIRTPRTAGSGETFPVQRTLENQGNATGTVPYNVYLTTPSGAMRVALVAQASRMLTGGELDTDVDLVSIPAQVAAGTYKIEYELDPDTLVDELLETNNDTFSPETITVEASELAIVSTTMPVATVGLLYQVDLAARGGTGPLTWTLGSGALPMGLALDGASGRISGTPSTEGMSTFSVRVTDGSLSDEKQLSILVASPTVPLAIVTRAIPPVWVGIPFNYPLTAIGGVPPYNWTVAPALPQGLTLTSTGTIGGATSTTAPSAVYTFTVTDVTGARVSSPMSVRVLDRSSAVRFGTAALQDGVVGTAYASMIEAVNGDPPYTFSLAEGTLPPGLSIEEDRLAGVPTMAGEYTFLLRVTDNRGDFDLNYFIVRIDPAEGVHFVTKGLPVGETGKEYFDEGGRPVFLKAISTGSMGMIHYALGSGALPAGLMLGDDGRVQGTPSMAGTSAFTVIASDDLGQTDVRAFGIAVNDPASITPASGGSSGCGCSAASPRAGGASYGGLAMFALVGVAFALRRVRRRAWVALFGLALALVVAPSSALAQRGDGGPPPPPPLGDGSVSPGSDGGGSVSGGGVQYFTSSRTESYVSRNGGMALFFPSNDDSEVVVSLPFTFRYWDNDYTDVHISTNGYVAFNDTAITFVNDGIPSSNTPNNIICGWWDDLWTTDVTVYTEGTSPNQIEIIQWRMTRQLSAMGSSFDMQIWLYEGPAARFEIHYGPQSGIVMNPVYSGSIGFENVDGTVGFSLASCTPNCSNSDLSALPDTVLMALQDAGTDLAAASVSLTSQADPLRVYQGIPFDVASQINSYHADPIGPFTYSLYLLGINEQQPSQPPFFTSSPIVIQPYQSLQVTDAVSIPITTPQGRYKVALQVDPDNQVNEPNEQNNLIVGAQQFIVGERHPDLTVPSVSAASAMAAPGGTLDVTVTLQNAGNLDTDTAWKLVLSPNGSPSASDPSVFSSTSNVTLGPGESQTVSVTAHIPSDLTPGRYYVGVLADPANTVIELDEVNNVGRTMSPIQIGTGALDVTTTELPVAYEGVDYDVRLEASGGDGTFVWELTSGTLQAGLTFLPATGQIRGKPTETGTQSINVRVTSAGLSSTKTLALDVEPISGPLTIVTRNLLPGTVGVAYPPAAADQDPSTQQHILAIGGSGTATFTLTSPAPAGLTLDSDGYLHGTPAARGNYDLDITATDGTTTVMRTIPLSIVEPGRLSLLVGTLPNGVLGQPYSYSFYTVGQAPGSSLEFGLVDSAGGLPDGMTLSASGELAGTPGHAGVYHFAVEVVEHSGSTSAARDSANFTLQVDASTGITITPSMLPDAIVGTPYEVTIEARQGTTPYTWTLDITGELPRGLHWEMIEQSGEQKIRISGTAEEVPGAATQNTNTGGIIALFAHVGDAQGRHADQALTLRVIEASKMVATSSSSGCGCTEADRGRKEGSALGLFFVLAGALGLVFGARKLWK